MTIPCYIFDIDGTLADCSHRLHHIQREPKNWDSFFADCYADEPIWHIIRLARNLYLHSNHHAVVFVSGRSDQCREPTQHWLLNHGLPSDPLYMRKQGDHRDDDTIKIELLAELRRDGFEPIMAFDDRDRVVAAWRKAGVPCAQVAPGDF